MSDAIGTSAGNPGANSAAAGVGASPLMVVMSHVAMLVASIGVWSSIGGPHGPVEGIAAVLLAGTWPAVAYAIGVIGIGELALGWLRVEGDALVRWAVRLGLGLAITLTASHAMAMAGWFAGVFAIIGVGVAGSVAWIARCARSERGWQPPSRAWLAVQPAFALVFTAASSPPGWLWESEARGYDALSYHLQLPKEWLQIGRLVPLEHNVYSYLPSYVEAAFAQMLRLAAADVPALFDGGMSAAIGPQKFHALMALGAAVAIAACVRVMMPRAARGVAGAAAAVSLAVPWVVVVGSLAYNEMAAGLLSAVAVMVAVMPGLGAVRRGALAGLLVGVACGCKPTAMLFTTPVVGLALAATLPRREWVAAIASAAVVGTAALAPWLVRNVIAGGNPVFPFAAGVFGGAHWSAEQLTRYASGHHFTGSLVDRLRMLVMLDPSDPSGPRHRGMLHPQWSVFFPVLLVAAVIAIAPWRRAVGEMRLAVWLIAALVVQVAAWLVATHLQSRFLLPMLAPGVIVIALAASRLRLRWGVGVLMALAAVLLVSSTRVFMREPVSPEPGRPNLLLLAGPDLFTGRADLVAKREAEAAGPQAIAAWREALPPEAMLNVGVESPWSRDGAVLLVGGATPFYVARPVLYATTWDVSPLGREIAASPGDPSAWTAGLVWRGARYALVNLSELDRLRRSGWLEPTLVKAMDDGSLRRWLDGLGRPRGVWPDGTRPTIVLFDLAGGRSGGGAR